MFRSPLPRACVKVEQELPEKRIKFLINMTKASATSYEHSTKSSQTRKFLHLLVFPFRWGQVWRDYQSFPFSEIVCAHMPYISRWVAILWSPQPMVSKHTNIYKTLDLNSLYMDDIIRNEKQCSRSNWWYVRLVRGTMGYIYPNNESRNLRY